MDIQRKLEDYCKQIVQLTEVGEYNKLPLLIDNMKSIEQDEEYKCKAELFFYIATCYGIYSNSIIDSGGKITDSCVMKQFHNSMYYFRRALEVYEEYDNLNILLKIRILLNYANTLYNVGRVFEALRLDRYILDIEPTYAIAVGNYGVCLKFLANMVNDNGQYEDIQCYAYQAIKRAVSIHDNDLYEQAVVKWEKIIEDYEKTDLREKLQEEIIYKKYPLGETDEAEYRNWCLNNHLFLNPLNEVIEKESAFAHDPLTITSYLEDTYLNTRNYAEPPKWYAMLNQLKEEYAYSRYLCYKGSQGIKEQHFADKDVLLSLSTYDDCSYSIRIEQLKSAFKNLYSMFDQIAFFINEFWNLGLKERKADAKNVFDYKKYPKDNTSLMSLYYLMCEFSEKYGDSDDPYEKDLVTLRNAIEHKYVKVHAAEWNRNLQMENDSFYHVTEDFLIQNIMRLLELVREALFYLVYAINIEEIKKGKPSVFISMKVDYFADEWKI